MSIRTERELQGLRRVGRVVAVARDTMARHLRLGITTRELDEIGAAVLAHHGARSAPRLCVGFPGTTCISVNEEAAHGIPGDRRIYPGDVVNVDVSAELSGFFADTGASYPVPPVAAGTRALCRHTRRAFRGALAAMRPAARINETGRAVEREAQRANLCAIRNLWAHGVGRWLHEEPLEIANVFIPGDRRRFSEGIVVAMESFLADGTQWVVQSRDGWTLRTSNGGRAAQYEHTVVVTANGPLIVTHP